MPPKTVLITGCSDGGMGAALAIAMDKAGYKVFATARNVSKMSSLPSSIEKLSLEVNSKTSIEKCAEDFGQMTDSQLNILVNNAGVRSVMPLMDLELADARSVFETNVWSTLAVSQTFLPFLLKAQKTTGTAIIANHSSTAGVGNLPMQGVYNASNAALSSLTHTLRLELEPFGIKVIDLKSGSVMTDIFRLGDKKDSTFKLPSGSLYSGAAKELDTFDRGELLSEQSMSAADWATGIVQVLSKSNPPSTVWLGGYATLMRIAQYLPEWFLKSTLLKLSGMDAVWRSVRENDKRMKTS